MAANVTLTTNGPLWAGTAAEKSAVVPANNEHALYYEIDTGLWYIWSVNAWVAYAAPGPAGGSGSNTPVTGVPGSMIRARGTLNSVSPGVIAAAGDYSAGDVLNNSTVTGLPWIFTVGRAAGGGILIQKVLITCNDAAIVPRFRLHLFNALPGTLQADNVAFLLAAADRNAYLGYIDMPAMQTSGSSELSWSESDLQWIGVTGAATTLWGVLQTLDTFTNEAAGMTMDIYLTGVQS